LAEKVVGRKIRSKGGPAWPKKHGVKKNGNTNAKMKFVKKSKREGLQVFKPLENPEPLRTQIRGVKKFLQKTALN